jgi:hypothetical protein
MELKQIPLTLERSDMPKFPGSLPISCTFEIVTDDLSFHAKRAGTLGADIAFTFRIPKDSVVKALLRLKPDVPDDFEYNPWNQPEVSELEIRHRDPFEVVPYFTTVFSSTKRYWIKAFAKMLSDKLKLTVSGSGKLITD